VAWLRERADAGDEICLHGDLHLQQGPVAAGGDRARAALFTDGEGECLSLTDDARARMLVEGRRRLEELVGRRIFGFVAPAWLEPRGFGVHLRSAGFRWHEGTLWVERLAGRTAAEPRRFYLTPVIGFATRTEARLAAALAWAGALAPAVAAARAAGCGPELVRIALHPGDAGSAAVLRAAEHAVKTLLDGYAPDVYARALGVAPPEGHA
jgi:predicted deacetylase